MAVTVNVEDANIYFENEVLHSQAWDVVDEHTRQKAINNAERVLYRYFRDYYDLSDENDWMPIEAVYEQALWLLRQDDAIRKTDFGVIGLSVSGIHIQMKGNSVSLISPETYRILEEDNPKITRKLAYTVM